MTEEKMKSEKPEMEEVLSVGDGSNDFEGLTTDFQGKPLKLNPAIVAGFHDDKGPKM